MDAMQEQVNRFLVDNFNNILRWEEQVLVSSLGGKLSVSEFHVIEAVIDTADTGDNTMSEVAARLSVTVGTLTTSIKTLSAKGFVLRQKGEADKRLVWLIPTPQAVAANEFHKEFHRKMVNGIIDCLDHRQLEALLSALDVLGGWFRSVQNEASYISIEEETKTNGS